MARPVTITFRINDNGTVEFLKDSEGAAADLDKTLDKTGDGVSRFGKVAGVAFAAVAAGAVAFRTLAKAVEARGIQQIAEDKLAQALANQGESADESLPKLKALAAELQTVSNFGDEVQLTAASMLLTFREVGGSQGVGLLLPRLLDMSAGLAKAGQEGADLNSIAAAIGKSLSEGASSLKRYGISLTEAQERQFNLAEGMDKVNLLTEILDANFQGLAQATVDPFKQLENSAGDLQETLGEGLRPVVEELATDVRELLDDKQTASFVRSIGESVGKVLQFLVGLIDDIAGFNRAVRVGIRQIVKGYRLFQVAIVDVQETIQNGIRATREFFGQDTSAVDESIRMLQIRRLALEAMIQGEEQLIDAIRAGDDALADQAETAASASGALANILGGTPTESGAGPDEKPQDRLKVLKERQAVLIQEGKVTAELVALNREILQLEQERKDLRTAGIEEEGTGLVELANQELIVEDQRQEFHEMALERARERLQAFEAQKQAAEELAEAEQAAFQQQVQNATQAVILSGNATQAILSQTKQIVAAKLAETIATALAPLGPLALALGPLIGAGIKAMFDRLLPGFNQGGLFRGDPGVDTNVVRLTDGEFVVNRDATARNLPLLEAINRGDRTPVQNSAMSGSSTINLRLSGELTSDAGKIKAVLDNVDVVIDETRGSIRRRTTT
jgi:hypothetical protein